MEHSYLFSVLNTAQNEVGLFGKPAFTISLLIESLILFAISAIIFIKRKSEKTQTPFIYKSVHIVLRALIIVAILAGTAALKTINPVVILLTILLHFIFDLVSFKNAKESAKSLVWYLLPVGLSFAICGSAYVTGEVMEFFGPTENNLEAISIYAHENDNFLFKSYRCNEINDNLWTTDKEALETALNCFSESKKVSDISDYDKDNSIIVKFKKKSGEESLRRIAISLEEYISIVKGIKSEEENKEILALPQWSEIKDTMFLVCASKETLTKEIYEQFREEYNSFSAENQAKCEINFKSILFGVNSDEKGWLYFHIDKDSFPKTTKLIYDSPEHNSLECANSFISQIKDIKENPERGEYLRVMPASGMVSIGDEKDLRVYIKSGVTLDNFYNALDASAISNTSGTSELYYVELEDKYYFFALDENILSMVKAMK